MASTPVIIVQLVHIEGPMKTEIQEFSEPEISIGRQPTCHVQFPKDLAIISRKHARIIREGNRFKLIDQSANGTFLNGKRVQEAFLKNGDVLIFAEGGPKISFLTKIIDARDKKDAPSKQRPTAPTPPIRHDAPPAYTTEPEPVPAEEIPVGKTQVPLIIQYGPTLRSFKELPVTIGKNPNSDFILEHPAILDRHAQFFFSQDQYWVKDLSGQNRIMIDGRPIRLKAPLHPENRLSLSSQGPSFRFLDGGRLAEIEEVVPQKPDMRPPRPENKASRVKQSAKSPKRAGDIFKKFFQR
jgi:pSer/pThr/pTyr-binding forkhead associated (FHA) protein